MSKDYYKILGVDKQATEGDIKKAYRTLAHQYHPDRPSGNEARFKEINEAYQVLSNKEKRTQYDRFGQAFDHSTGSWPGGAGGWPSGMDFGFDFDPNNINFEDMGGLGDMFDFIFEGMGVKRKRRTYQRGADVQVDLVITLEEAFRGVETNVTLETFDACGHCSGAGHFTKEGYTTCAACNGRGEIKENQRSFFGSFAKVKRCEKCFGAGQIPNKSCLKCSGVGRVRAKRLVQVGVVPGVSDGQFIKITKGGEAGERGAERGDLYVRISIKPHAYFRRDGDNLITAHKLDIIDVLLGKPIAVRTISGGARSVTIPTDHNLNEPLHIRGEGMPKLGSYGRGDLFVQFIVRVPKKLSTKAKKILDDLRREVE